MMGGSAVVDPGRVYPCRCPSGRAEASKKICIPLYGDRGDRYITEMQMVVEDVSCVSVSAVSMEDDKADGK